MKQITRKKARKILKGKNFVIFEHYYNQIPEFVSIVFQLVDDDGEFLNETYELNIGNDEFGHICAELELCKSYDDIFELFVVKDDDDFVWEMDLEDFAVDWVSEFDLQDIIKEYIKKKEK